MTMSKDEAQFTATQDGLKDLLGVAGLAQTDLRPGGFALLNGHRVDVITQGRMIGKGERVTVVSVESNRVVVKQSNPS
jgi:membrane-bound serine protease (ClpP class)